MPSNPCRSCSPNQKPSTIQAGIAKNWFGLGDTAVYGEYGEAKDSIFETSAFGNTSKAHLWGLGVNQYIDAADMEVFATYKNYEFSGNGFTGANATLNGNVNGVHDLQIFMVGTKINF